MIVDPENRKPLTEFQSKLLHFVVNATQQTGVQPSLSEIGRALGLSAQAVHYQLREIDRLGWINAATGRMRGIEIPLDVREEMTDEGSAELPEVRVE